MNRKEIADLLEIVINAYPHTKIQDAGAVVSAWELTLGDFSAEAVYKAARLHMNTCKFFPTPSDIRDKIVRASIAYPNEQPEVLKLEDHQSNASEVWSDEKMEEFCKWVGFGYPEEGSFLPYEL